MDYIERLKKFPLFEKLSEEDLKSFAELLNPLTSTAGSDIITEGETGSDMYFLIEGSVDIIKTTVFGDRFVCASLDSSMGCVFGEMALIDSDKRSATVKAKTDCTSLVISRSDFNSFADSHPAAGVSLLRFIGVNLVRNIRKENENLNLVYQALIEEIESN
ncbi:MAG: cyclic nucleotide-binding domain-containing protein [Lachnospiraceae bacterium]|nr:cyclic nucleotide-binding domain-containing protein [Lachnospiraceae bacterium]